MKRLNAEWVSEGRKPMPMRIGVHCANVVVGNVGSPQRLSYTVMGDGVNIASRVVRVEQALSARRFASATGVYEHVAEHVIARTRSS